MPPTYDDCVPAKSSMSVTDVVIWRAAGLAVFGHEDPTHQLAHVEVPADGDVVIVVGPEAGLCVDERATFEGAGAGAYRVGNTVLRTSTAGVAVLSLLSAKRRWR